MTGNFVIEVNSGRGWKMVKGPDETIKFILQDRYAVRALHRGEVVKAYNPLGVIREFRFSAIHPAVGAR